MTGSALPAKLSERLVERELSVLAFHFRTEATTQPFPSFHCSFPKHRNFNTCDLCFPFCIAHALGAQPSTSPRQLNSNIFSASRTAIAHIWRLTPRLSPGTPHIFIRHDPPDQKHCPRPSCRSAAAAVLEGLVATTTRTLALEDSVRTTTTTAATTTMQEVSPAHTVSRQSWGGVDGKSWVLLARICFSDEGWG